MFFVDITHFYAWHRENVWTIDSHIPANATHDTPKAYAELLNICEINQRFIYKADTIR